MLIPLFLIICMAIKVTSRGPIFFGHLRYGRDGKAFRAFKFRTMVTNADQILEGHLELMREWQLNHKLKNDPRITPVGRWLRRYSLDELPQLFNIIAWPYEPSGAATHSGVRDSSLRYQLRPIYPGPTGSHRAMASVRPK